MLKATNIFLCSALPSFSSSQQHVTFSLSSQGQNEFQSWIMASNEIIPKWHCEIAGWEKVPLVRQLILCPPTTPTPPYISDLLKSHNIKEKDRYCIYLFEMWRPVTGGEISRERIIGCSSLWPHKIDTRHPPTDTHVRAQSHPLPTCPLLQRLIPVGGGWLKVGSWKSKQEGNGHSLT